MLKRLLLTCLTLVGVVFLSGAQPYEYPPDMREIAKRGKLVVAMCAQDRPPFVVTGADGTLSGMDVELARSIGDRLGVPTEIDRSAATYDEVINRVAKGNADIGISLLSATTERARRVLFTEPYLYVCPSLLVNRRKEIDLKRKAAGKDWLHGPGVSIGVMRGSSYEEFVREFFPSAQITTYNRWKVLNGAVLRGDVTAVLQSGAVLCNMIMDEPAIYLTHRLIRIEGKEDRFACALPATSIYFLTWVNLLLAQRENLSHRPLEEVMIRNWNNTGAVR
ncbi:MAG: amino acid ABC transporter substrate-binding protein [Deltaproteobacteria bacterium]|nr:amino acid ABC transporter substrate-binding protein [Deltaproteobacteria bacterium]